MPSNLSGFITETPVSFSLVLVKRVRPSVRDGAWPHCTSMLGCEAEPVCRALAWAPFVLEISKGWRESADLTCFFKLLNGAAMVTVP